jgi:putative membrane protein
MLLIKSLHLIFMVTWMAGLLYLPRLFVYHAQTDDRISLERFKVMERKLFWGIATPGGSAWSLYWSPTTCGAAS